MKKIHTKEYYTSINQAIPTLASQISADKSISIPLFVLFAHSPDGTDTNAVTLRRCRCALFKYTLD